MTPDSLVLGTRASLLATTQSGHVRDWLMERHPGLLVDVVHIKTEGDHLQQHPLAPGETLPKGLFTGALEQALSDRRINLAVHSMKDLPTDLGQGLIIAAVPVRADPRDAFLSNGPCFEELTAGARIATGSPRRSSQLRRLRPDIEVVPVRGNVDTRIGKLRAGEFDGMVLAAAGLERLGRLDEVVEYFAPDRLLPAPGQGALAIEMRLGRKAEWVRQSLDDADTRVAVDAERAVLIGIGGGCSLPLGTFARVEGDQVRLSAVLFDDSGTRAADVLDAGPREDAEALGRRVARRLLESLGTEPAS